eukprot:1161802-Pelagomonas_calceolata.AAC.15
MEAVRSTPFFLNYGQHPSTPVSGDLLRFVHLAQDFTEGFAKAVRETKECSGQARRKIVEYAKRLRREVRYEPEEPAMLNTKNLQGSRGGWFSGSAAVELKPPNWSKIHIDVLHVILVKLYYSKSVEPSAVCSPQPVQWLEGEPIHSG